MPREHPIYDAFHFSIFEKIEKIRQRLSPSRNIINRECDMEALWHITNTPGEGTMDNFAKRVKKFCFASF